MQQIDHFGRQLKKVDFLRHTYLATSEPYCHLLVNLDPKTSECLRFSSKITSPGPSVFHLPAEVARETNLSNEREKRAYTQALAVQKDKERIQKVLCQCDSEEIKFLRECALNIITGNIPFDVYRLFPFEKQRRIVCDITTLHSKRRKTLCSVKGIKLLQEISRSITSYLTE